MENFMSSRNMRRALAAMLWLCGLMAAPVSSPAAAPPETIRLDGTLLGVDGAPAAGVTVLLAGMDRMNWVKPDVAAQQPHYHVTTDAQGRFAFEFKAIPAGPHGYSPSPPDELPGVGEYYAVVPPAADGRYAGAISGRIHNDRPDIDPRYNTSAHPDWITLSGEGTSLTLRLAAGVTLTGRVLDETMQPVAGRSVTNYVNLHASTHTGGGGEIFERTVVTDAQGRFQIENLYPGVQTLTIDDGTSRPWKSNWTRTRVGAAGEWVEDCLDEIDVADPESRSLEIMISGKNLFEYSGTVRDETGKPVSGATVGGSLSYHRTPKTYHDFHAHTETNTDAQGQYRIMAPTPWVMGLGAAKDGYAGMGISNESKPIAPGTVNFVLNTQAPLTLSGMVVDGDGRPAAGVELALILAGRDRYIDVAEARLRPYYHARSGSDGRFSFSFLTPATGWLADEGVPPVAGERPGSGKYYIVAIQAADGGAGGAISPLVSNSFNTPTDPDTGRKILNAVLVGDADAPPLVLRLVRGVALEGKIVDAVTAEPLAGQTVTLQPSLCFGKNPQPYWPPLLRHTATTDAQGQFRFENFEPTTQTLTVAPAQNWTSTRLGAEGPWIDKRIDSLDFAEIPARRIEIATSNQPPSAPQAPDR